jgi:thioredoxin 1
MIFCDKINSKETIKIFREEFPISQALSLDQQSFQNEVLESSVPVLVDFWAEWCGPCKRLGPVIDELAAHYGDKVKVTKVNVDENQSLAVEYGATSIPLLLFFKDGQVVDKHLGLAPKDVLSQKLDALL